MGNLGRLPCKVMSVCTCIQVHMTKCWLKPLSLFRWPAVEAAVERKHAGSPCAIPTDRLWWPPATVTTLSKGRVSQSHCQTTEDFRGAGQCFVLSTVPLKVLQTWNPFICTAVWSRMHSLSKEFNWVFVSSRSWSKTNTIYICKHTKGAHTALV